jgi:PAS domain S-box-containing protein
MDIKTIIILTIFVNALIFVFFFFFIKISSFNNKILNLYVIAKGIHVGAWLFLILRGIYPSAIIVAIANSLIILAFGMETLAITTASGKNINKRLKLFLQLSTLLILGFIAILHCKENIRIVYISLVIFVWYVIGAQQFLIKKDRSKLKVVAGIIFFVFAILSFVRAYSAAFWSKDDLLYDTNMLQTIVFSSIFLSNFVGVVILLLLLKEEEEKTISISNERYEKFIENLPQIVFEIDIEGNLVYVNRKALELTGFSKKEFGKGLNITDILFEDNIKQAKESIRDIVEGGIETGKEYVMKKKDGSGMPVLIYSSPIYIKDKVIGLRGIVVDISLRKKAEQKLIESEQNYKLLFDNSPLGIYTADTNGSILDANEQLLKLIGSPSLEETKKINILKFQPLIDNGYTKKFIEICNTGEIERFSTFYKSKWGKSIYLSNTIVPLKDKNGNVNKIYTVMEDVSEQKNIELELQERDKYLTSINKQLNELIATKDMFFSIIAHDLKGPIGTVVGFSKLLVDNFDKYEMEEQKKYIKILHSSVDKTYRLLENLLLWSKSQQKTLQFNPENENLFLLSNESIDILKHVAQNKNITIENNISKDVVVNADRDMVLTIFRNLLTNAIKFTNKDGRIELDTQTSEQDGYVDIIIKDNGVGMSEKKQMKLFDIAENTISKGTENEEGTGLGLILCKEFVEKHKGKIHVESEEGKGTTFTISLPEIV